MDPIEHFARGDIRRSDTINENDGTFLGLNAFIASPVFYKDRVYVPIGQDPEHGRGRGALWCIDAAKMGDITGSEGSSPGQPGRAELGLAGRRRRHALRDLKKLSVGRAPIAARACPALDATPRKLNHTNHRRMGDRSLPCSQSSFTWRQWMSP
jgi:hypothetical protein